MRTNVLIMLASKNTYESSILLLTCDSVAKFTTLSRCSSSKSLYSFSINNTPLYKSKVSIFHNRSQCRKISAYVRQSKHIILHSGYLFHISNPNGTYETSTTSNNNIHFSPLRKLICHLLPF